MNSKLGSLAAFTYSFIKSYNNDMTVMPEGEKLWGGEW